MNLKEATIRVVDFETTGFDSTKEKICEVGWCDVKYQEDYGWITEEPQDQLLDPRIPIPSVSKAVHHITEKMVAGEPTAEDFLPQVFNNEVDLFAAHNADFDKAFAVAAGAPDTAWLCTYRLALHRLPDMPSHKNQVIRYELGFDNVPGDAHRAGHDAKVTAMNLCYMLNAAETELTTQSVVEYAERPVFLKGEINFGKHRGTKWTDLPMSYLQWMQKQGSQEGGNADGWDRDQWYTICKILGG